MIVESEELLRLPFDQYQRYRSVSQLIERLKQDNHLPDRPRILDVGGYPGVMRKFLPHDNVTVVDLPPLEEPWYVQGDGCNLPFEDGACDAVVSLDTLEHVASEDRDVFISELVRVSGKLVVICAPFDDPLVRHSENLLFEFIKTALKAEHQQLKEHISNGLPDLRITSDVLRSSARFVSVYPSGYVFNWLKVMLVNHYLMSVPGTEELSAHLNEFYNRYFYNADQKAPSYRHVIMGWKHQEDAAFKCLDDFASAHTSSATISQGDSMAELSLLTHFLSMSVANRADRILLERFTLQEVHVKNLEQLLNHKDKQTEDAIREKDVHIANLEAAIGLKDNHITNLETAVGLKDKYVADLERNSGAKESHIRNLEDELSLIKRGRVLRFLNWVGRKTNR